MKGFKLFAAKDGGRSGLLLVLICGTISGGWTAGGCSRAPEEPAWFQETATGHFLESDQVLSKISKVDSLFELYRMKREYILRGGDSKDVMQSLDERRDQLVGKAPTFPAIPGKLDFCGWDIEKVGDNEYQVFGYFVVTGKMDRDWILKIMANVDDKHIQMLPLEQQKAGRAKWQVYPKTSTWDVGEHHILGEIIELRPIPYHISARFFLWPELINQDVFSYGWFADPDLIPEDQISK